VLFGGGGVSEEDVLRRARQEIALLEAERVRLSAEVMEGKPEALEQDEQLRQRIAELGHWLWEAERGRGEAPPPEEVGGGTA
jgi:hypothetical protein